MMWNELEFEKYLNEKLEEWSRKGNQNDYWIRYLSIGV